MHQMLFSSFSLSHFVLLWLADGWFVRGYRIDFWRELLRTEDTVPSTYDQDVIGIFFHIFKKEIYTFDFE